MNLRAAKVIGFFSLPSASLAEQNPSAYNNAMAAAPHGAGTCAHCGTGIIHHVVIEADGKRAFIGTDCASRIGGEVGACARSKQTAEQKAASDADRMAAAEARQAKWQVEQDEQAARKAARSEAFKDVLATLRAQGTSFHNSLADQLTWRRLSESQAGYVAKAVFGRYSKRNAVAWDELTDRLTENAVEAA